MQSAGPIRIVTSYRYMANGRNTASRFYLTVQEVPDLQNRLKRRFNLICQPAVQRTFIRAYLRCDRRFAASPICNLHLQTFIRNHHDVEQTGIREVVFFHSSDASLLPYQGRFPFDVVGDPGKKFYKQFGVESSPLAILSPSAWAPMVKGNLARDKPAMKGFPEDGALGLPAEFLISPEGNLWPCITAATLTTSGLWKMSWQS